MQRLFSMFPAGAPGLALFVLRLATVAWLHVDASGRLAASAHLPVSIALAILSLALLVGGFTPYVASLAAVIKAIDMLVGGSVPGLLGAIAVLHFVVLLLLGPGAFSVDALSFGRRVTVLTGPREK
jgi:hypothetical protein